MFYILHKSWIPLHKCILFKSPLKWLSFQGIRVSARVRNTIGMRAKKVKAIIANCPTIYMALYSIKFIATKLMKEQPFIVYMTIWRNFCGFFQINCRLVLTLM